MSEDNRDEKKKSSKFEILEEDGTVNLELEKHSPKLPESPIDDEDTLSQSQYNSQDSYQAFQNILDSSKPEEAKQALDKLSEKYKDAKFDLGISKEPEEEANSSLLKNIGIVSKEENSQDNLNKENHDEQTINTKEINEEVTNIINEDDEMDPFKELLKLGETNPAVSEVKEAEKPEGLHLPDESIAEEEFKQKEGFSQPLIKKRKDRSKKYDHDEISIKGKTSQKMNLVHPEQNNLYEEILESVEEEEDDSSNHTRTMNKKEYFGFDKFALEFTASPFSFLIHYWKTFILGTLSFGLFFKWHQRKAREFLLSHTFFRAYPFEFVREQSSFSVISFLHSIFLLLIPVSFSFDTYIGSLHLALSSFSIGFIVLEKYHNLFNNLKYQDIAFALNLSHKEYFKLGLSFSLKVLFSLGFFTPRAVRDLQEYLFTKLRYGRIYFRISHKYRVLNDTPIYHLILPSIFIVAAIAVSNQLGYDWKSLAEEYILQTQTFIAFGVFMGLYLYVAIKNEILTHLFTNLNIRNSKFQYKGSFTKHMYLFLSNLVLIILSLGILYPIAKWRTHKYYVKNIRVYISRPGGLKEIVDNAA